MAPRRRQVRPVDAPHHHRTDRRGDRKSTRLNSSHVEISYAVFCLKKKMMAALSLLLVTVWLVSVGKSWLYAGLPALFMYVTNLASLLVTAYTIYATVYNPNLAAGH